MAVVAVLVVLMLVGAGLVEGVLATHRARAAADLAALAAAAALQEGGVVCAAAVTVAQANASRVTACRPAADESVTVAVATEVALGGWSVAVDARARAGPDPHSG